MLRVFRVFASPRGDRRRRQFHAMPGMHFGNGRHSRLVVARRPVVRFVADCEARGGSSYFISTLSSHDHVCTLAEVFMTSYQQPQTHNCTSADSDPRHDCTHANFSSRMGCGQWNNYIDNYWPSANPHDYLHAIWNAPTPHPRLACSAVEPQKCISPRAVGFKLIDGQAEEALGVASRHGFRSISPFAATYAHLGVRVLRMYRNPTDRLISTLRHYKGVEHCYKSDTSCREKANAITTQIKPDMLKSHIELFVQKTRERRALDRAGSAPPTLWTWYEDLIDPSTSNATWCRVQRFLHLPCRPLVSNLAKITSSRRSVLGNYFNLADMMITLYKITNHIGSCANVLPPGTDPDVLRLVAWPLTHEADSSPVQVIFTPRNRTERSRRSRPTRILR